jgi:hypothetical protein
MGRGLPTRPNGLTEGLNFRDFPYPLRGPSAGCLPYGYDVAIPFGEYALGDVSPSQAAGDYPIDVHKNTLSHVTLPKDIGTM